MARRLAVVVNSRANYGRIKSVLAAATKHPALDLQLIVGASALLYRFGNVHDVIVDDGFTPVARVYSIIEGENPTTMAKSTGMAILELATLFENIDPHVVLTVADRFETLGTAVAASYMNIPVAHTQGGEITGSIDESVRHAVTKLSHLHFPATERAGETIIRMGEDPENVHVVGCPSLDLISEADLTLPENIFARYKGVGPDIDPAHSYLLVLQHPVTTEYGDGVKQVNQTLKAVTSLGMQVVWLWPNVDAGSDDVSKGLREFREKERPTNVHFYRNFSPEDYARVLNGASCIVGNSSSGLREGAFLGVPAVNIGSRQAGRERAANVVDVPYDAAHIEIAIRDQLSKGRYPRSHLYGDGGASDRIVEILATARPAIQKRLTY